MATYEVELKNINKMFGTFKASDNVSFAIERGKLIGLLGSSGSGKTTILRMIAGLETPDSGDIFIGGRRVNGVDPGKRGIGFLFQSYALFRHMTVFDNIAFGLEVQKKPANEIKERVECLAELIGLKDFTTRHPMQLSGGRSRRRDHHHQSRTRRAGGLTYRNISIAEDSVRRKVHRRVGAHSGLYDLQRIRAQRRSRKARRHSPSGVFGDCRRAQRNGSAHAHDD